MANPPSRDRVKIALVEDEDLYRDLLTRVLTQHPHVEVVGSFADGATALREIPRLRPQVVLLDIELGQNLNGIQVGLRLRRHLPHVGIVILSNHGDPHFVSSLPEEVLAGWSYLLKRSVSDADALVRAIEGAAAGFLVLDRQLTARAQPKTSGLLSLLTPRQREVLALMAQGFTNTAIAQRLVLTEKTVENQVNLIYQKLGIERGTAAAHPRVKAVLLYLQDSFIPGIG